MLPPNWSGFSALIFALALLAAACGDDSESTSGEGSPKGQTANGPAPADMCPSNQSPALAAYDLATGAFKWASCGSREVRHTVLDATEEVVYVARGDGRGGELGMVAYDVADGSELSDAGPSETSTTLELDQTPGGPASFVVEGVRIQGGQDDPTVAFDEATGKRLWSAPGHPAYDDVWAVGDGAVYIMEFDGASGRLLAYELRSGDVRWQDVEISEPDPGEISERDPSAGFVVFPPWPWHVDGDRLFAIGTDIVVFSTDDGSTIWRTKYPVVEFPRMTDVRANSDTVFVAFSSIASGGD